MDSLWPTLVQFLLRLCFGLSLAMAITPASWVTSGYYRVHLWVVMGLATFASLGVYSNAAWYAEFSSGGWQATFAACVALAFVSYLGAVIWIYERATWGKAALVGTTSLAALGAMSAFAPRDVGPLYPLAAGVNWFSSGITLGGFLAAMFLGHWYLNWPGMKLEPLKRLVLLSGCSLVLRGLLAVLGLYFALTQTGAEGWTTITWSLLLFRWLTSIIGPAVMAYLTWQTLKIPNTQSATGILYAAVIFTFLGELTSQLLSRSLLIPV